LIDSEPRLGSARLGSARLGSVYPNPSQVNPNPSHVIVGVGVSLNPTNAESDRGLAGSQDLLDLPVVVCGPLATPTLNMCLLSHSPVGP